MSVVRKTWDVLSNDECERLVKQIMSFFQTERDEQIGTIAANELLDFFLELLEKPLYNKAISDTKDTCKRAVDDLELALDLLLRK